MRNFGLAIALASLSTCASDAEGDSDDATGDGGTGDDASGDDDSADDDSADDATDPTASSDSGGMSGCETGPLDLPIAGCMPVPPESTGDFAQDCVDRINQFRWECQCLPPLARWTDAEMCSDEQSGNDQSTGAAHGNFGACGESAQNTCPNWGSESDVATNCLQAMWDEGPGEPFEAHGHYINMSNTGYSKVACGFFSSGQGVWANQNFSP